MILNKFSKRTIAYVSKQRRKKVDVLDNKASRVGRSSKPVSDTSGRLNSGLKSGLKNGHPSTSSTEPSTPSVLSSITNLLDNVLEKPSSSNTKVLDLIFDPAASSPDYHGLDIPYATEQTPIVASKQQIRGVYSLFVEYLFSKQLMNLTPKIYSCPYFSAYYYPSTHFLSQGRKSRPSLLCLYSKGEENNGETYPVDKLSPNFFKRSRNPMNYAVWRNYINKSYKEALYEALKSSPNIPDGVFMLRATKVTTDKSLLEKHMTEVVRKANGMLDKENTRWVVTANSKVDYYRFNQLLRSRFLPPIRNVKGR